MNHDKESLMVVFTTIDDSDRAYELARMLVDERLAACVSVSSPIASVYRWKNKIETETEWQLMIKTRKTLYPEVELFLKENHPYEVPEIMAICLEKAESHYFKWMEENTILPDE